MVFYSNEFVKWLAVAYPGKALGGGQGAVAGQYALYGRERAAQHKTDSIEPGDPRHIEIMALVAEYLLQAPKRVRLLSGATFPRTGPRPGRPR